MRLASRW